MVGADRSQASAMVEEPSREDRKEKRMTKSELKRCRKLAHRTAKVAEAHCCGESGESMSVTPKKADQ